MWKQIILGVLLGLGIIIVVQVLTQFINFWYINHLAQSLSPILFLQHRQHPSTGESIFYTTLAILRYSSFIIAGYFCVRLQKRNWIYAVYLGLLWVFVTYLVSISLTLLFISIPDRQIATNTKNAQIIKQSRVQSISHFTPIGVFYLLVPIALTSIGGKYAERKVKSKRKKKL